MKVLDLHCTADHVFEGWFASEEDFQDQRARGLVECPLCGDKDIAKKLTAARLNLGRGSHARAEAAGPERSERPSGRPANPETRGSPGLPMVDPGRESVASPAPAALQAAWMQAVRHVLAHTEDVGERFAEEARRIHYGEAQERGIRGQATREETLALLEEGVGVLPLPLPKGLKGPLQ